MPESGTSGSVRDRDGQPPGLLDHENARYPIQEDSGPELAERILSW